MDRRSYLVVFLSVVFILGLIVVYVFEFHYFDRTLHFGSLLAWSVAAGVLGGALLGYRFQKPLRELIEKVQVYLFFIILSALFAPLFGSLSNRLLAWRPEYPVAVEFLREEPRYANRFGAVKGEKVEANQFYLFFYKDGELTRIKTDSLQYQNLESGDTITLLIRKGFWGYEVVL